MAFNSLQVVAGDSVMVPGRGGGPPDFPSDKDDQLGTKIKTQKHQWTKI